MMRRTWRADEWAQADQRTRPNDDQDECSTSKQHQRRAWRRTVLVPPDRQPIDLIKTYRHKLPLPACYAGQNGINKQNVECIASAMADPNLRWRNMFDFVIAPYEPRSIPISPGSAGASGPTGGPYDFDPAQYAGKPVLIAGHHRFLALLLCGLPPAELPPIHVRTAALSVAIFRWSVVEWSA